MNTISLGEVIDSRENNFNLIRFIAASLVLYSHSFPLLLGKSYSEYFSELLGFSLGYLAVDVFFVTSGLLVCKSLCRHELKNFIVSRALRIYPALWFSVLFCLTIGAVITSTDIYQYVFHEKFTDFVLYNTTIVWSDYQYLPGVFTSAPLEPAVNGSLWTLPWELKMYISLVGLGLLSIFSRVESNKERIFSFAFIAIAVISLILFVYYREFSSYHWFYSKFFRFASTFFLGGVLYTLRDYIVINKFILILLVVVMAATNFLNKQVFFYVFVILLPYLTICLAYISNRKLLTFNKLGDYSYGIYIYAWPIQQIYVTTFSNLSPYTLFVYSFLSTLILAYFSWHMIERPALNLKHNLITRS